MNNKALAGLILAILVVLGGIFFIITKQRTSNQLQRESQLNPTPTVFTLNQVTIELVKSGFSPKVITIKPTDQIRWINKTNEKATINSADHPVHRKFPELNLGEFPKDGNLYIMLKTPGTYSYHNHYNPSQSGTIIVK